MTPVLPCSTENFNLQSLDIEVSSELALRFIKYMTEFGSQFSGLRMNRTKWVPRRKLIRENYMLKRDFLAVLNASNIRIRLVLDTGRIIQINLASVIKEREDKIVQVVERDPGGDAAEAKQLGGALPQAAGRTRGRGAAGWLEGSGQDGPGERGRGRGGGPLPVQEPHRQQELHHGGEGPARPGRQRLQPESGGLHRLHRQLLYAGEP